MRSTAEFQFLLNYNCMQLYWCIVVKGNDKHLINMFIRHYLNEMNSSHRENPYINDILLYQSLL